MNTSLTDTIKHLPERAGVYQFYDASGTLLYVGKAKNLRKRVASYWTKSSHSLWTEMMKEDVTRIDTVEVKSEFDALLLENSYVKTLKPKYNIQLKDDKTFPYLVVTNDPFPKFSITRQVKADGSRYFGPYFSATYLKTLLKLIQLLYGVKATNDRSYEARSTVPPQIGLQARNLDNQEKYQEQVASAIRFLTSPQPQVELELRREMNELSKRQEFELAAVLRDRLLSLSQLRQGQSLFSPQGKNRDYIGISVRGKLISVYILFERDGAIVNHKKFFFELPTELPASELTEQVIDFVYIHGLVIPQEIVLEHFPSEESDYEQYLASEAGYRVKLIKPQRGQLAHRLATARDNADYQIKTESIKEIRIQNSLKELQQLLSLPSTPSRIEACDISNLGSQEIVGATIVFINGQPEKNEYRKYKIENAGQDDFASIRDLIFRRVSNKERPQPDLLLIDGGKGQLSAAEDALKLANKNIPLVALAKKEEELFLPHRSEPVRLSRSSDTLLLLMAMRDEVHRFGLQFHRFRRSKRFLPKSRKFIKKRVK